MIRFRTATSILAACLVFAVAEARADVLYVSEGQSVVTYNTASANPTPTTFATGLRSPEGLAFDSSGNLFVTTFSSSGAIEKITPGGVASVFASVPGDVTGLAFDPSGNLYAGITNSSGPYTVEKFTPAGVGSVFATLNAPLIGIAVDASSNVFVSIYAGGTDNTPIQKFTPGGVGSVFADTGLVSSGLAFDASGNLYSASDINRQGLTINKYTPTGVSSPLASAPGSPLGLAFDSAGNLFVADTDDHAIDKITPGGVLSVFATTGAYGPEYLAFASSPSSVPEPSTLLLTGLGAVSIGFVQLVRHRLRTHRTA